MTSGFPPNDNIRLEPGLKLDRYELLCLLAHGGMGSVWLARLAGKHGFEKVVALKTVLPQHAPDEQYRNMFLDEARLASRISHPNVAQTIDLGETNSILYFVMEWVDGDSLRKLRAAVKKKDKDFPVNVALRLASEACGALHVAHELTGEDGKLLNVVHRDISPQNILVSTLGSTKLIDFGIAKARERLAEATRTDEMRGKVDYIAPEQAMGTQIDRRADLWSLGAVLYYLIAGVPPFEAETQVASLLARIEGRKPVPLPPTVPTAVRAVIDKALARQPADRYATAADMQRAIEEAAPSAGPPVTAADIARFMKEHLSEGIERRRLAVQAALDEAASRSKKNQRFETPLEKSGSQHDLPSSPSLRSGLQDGGAGSSSNPVSSPSARSARDSVGLADDTQSSHAVLEDELVPSGLPRRRRLGVVVGGVCAFAVGIGVLGLALRGKEEGAAASEPTRAATAPPQPVTPTMARIPTDVAAAAPNPIAIASVPTVTATATASASASASAGTSVPPVRAPTTPVARTPTAPARSAPAPARRKAAIDDGF